jgi:hypothetical protein
MAQQLQAMMPHHRIRNNDAPPRRSQSTHLFPELEAPAKADRRRLDGAKLKRGPRLSHAELLERGTLMFAKPTRPGPLLAQRIQARLLPVALQQGLRCAVGMAPRTACC